MPYSTSFAVSRTVARSTAHTSATSRLTSSRTAPTGRSITSPGSGSNRHGARVAAVDPARALVVADQAPAVRCPGLRVDLPRVDLSHDRGARGARGAHVERRHVDVGPGEGLSVQVAARHPCAPAAEEDF